jgi:glycosyltransferase involved in cell wall biosynthesis
MATLLASASLVTLLSEFEANPVAVMEALALGRRVLVADTSGLSELARRGLARAIPLESSPNETARAIVEQLRSPEPAPFDLPSWDRCASALIDVYRTALRVTDAQTPIDSDATSRRRGMATPA